MTRPECTCGDPGQYPCERHDCLGGPEWVPWVCYRCGKIATALAGAVIRCTCGSRSLAGGGER